MPISERLVEYTVEGVTLEGLFVSAGPELAPAVLIAHAWAGRGRHEDDTARRLASLGYNALSADVYGKGVRGTTREENTKLLNAMRSNRQLLFSRLRAGVETLASQPEVDEARLAAIGYCFGGLCVLDIARGGAPVLGVASFHGLLDAPVIESAEKMSAKVLALHGWADPMATPEDVLAFTEEMTRAGADWQLHAYGNVLHAFSNPNANDPTHGTVYDPVAAARAWRSMTDFLADLFEETGG